MIPLPVTRAPRRQIEPVQLFAWIVAAGIVTLLVKSCSGSAGAAPSPAQGGPRGAVSAVFSRESQRSGGAHNPTAPGAAPGPAILAQLDDLAVRLQRGREREAYWRGAALTDSLARLHRRPPRATRRGR